MKKKKNDRVKVCGWIFVVYFIILEIEAKQRRQKESCIAINRVAKQNNGEIIIILIGKSWN